MKLVTYPLHDRPIDAETGELMTVEKMEEWGKPNEGAKQAAEVLKAINMPAQKCPKCGFVVSERAIARIGIKTCSRCKDADISTFTGCTMAGKTIG